MKERERESWWCGEKRKRSGGLVIFYGANGKMKKRDGLAKSLRRRKSLAFFLTFGEKSFHMNFVLW